MDELSGRTSVAGQRESRTVAFIRLSSTWVSDLDAGVAALERVRQQLKLYRASVLKAAVEGTLTAEWREQNPHAEPASELLNDDKEQRARAIRQAPSHYAVEATWSHRPIGYPCSQVQAHF
jgi:hypothetical protein